MSQLVNSFLSILLLSVALIATFAILEVKKAKDKNRTKILIKLHTVFGYIFVLLYTILIYYMIKKVIEYQEEFSPRVMFHIVLSLALIPLIVIKILISRRYKHLMPQMFALGLIIVIVVFVFTGISAGYYFLRQPEISFVSISEFDTDILDLELGQKALLAKCGKCHTLERVFRSYKTEEGWTESVNSMAMLDVPNISKYEVKQIIHFLVKQQEERIKKDTNKSLQAKLGETLIRQKCSQCHDLEKIYSVVKTKGEWIVTIDEMVEIVNRPGYLTDTEKQQIVDYLVKKKDISSFSFGKQLFQQKCSVCHDLKVAFDFDATDEEIWKEKVIEMQKYEPEIISDKDIEPIVKFLVEWKNKKASNR